MVLQLSHIKKKYKDHQVLRDISFSLDGGEVLSIIGPSGAGKSTIIRAINRLETVDSGSIKIGEDYLCREGVYSGELDGDFARKLGLVFQNYNLFPHMSVLENLIASPVNVFKLARREAEDLALAELRKLKLEDKKDSYPYQLSGGEKQRVAIARACILNPSIICLDEPTSALDPESRSYIEEIVQDLRARGIGVLIISHDMKFAKNVSDRILFLEEGRISDQLSREEFYNIENLRLASFVNA